MDNGAKNKIIARLLKTDDGAVLLDWLSEYVDQPAPSLDPQELTAREGARRLVTLIKGKLNHKGKDNA